jgi:histidine triad (HIT) family protein
MATLFTKIVNQEIPCYKVAETDDFLAFLDVRPLAKGHTLVIPKQEIDYIFDIPKPVYEQLFSFAQQVAKAIGAAIPCTKVGMAVVGLEVPHAHIHLVPINKIGDINFEAPRLLFTPDEFDAIAASIKSKIVA